MGTAPKPDPPHARAPAPLRGPVIEAVLRTVTRVRTFLGEKALTGATGFFFERADRLYLVTSRHVLIDEPSRHFPDRVEIEMHTDAHDLARLAVFSLPLYEGGRAAWHQARDLGGEIDVATLRIRREILQGMAPPAFTPRHLQEALADVEIGTPLLVLGFPLGFHDSRHHLPVARQAAVASAFGTRFQGQGLFLTDARTHRGSSGAPVVMRSPELRVAGDGLPWKLLGIHSSRMDMGGARSGGRRVARPELRLVCRCADGAHRGLGRGPGAWPGPVSGRRRPCGAPYSPVPSTTACLRT